MFNSESDDYQLEKTEKLIVENLYQNDVLIGYKKTIKQNNGYYREIIYDDKNQIISDKQYSDKGCLINGLIYTDGKVSHSIKTAIDSSGYRHELLMNTQHQIISHSKFDKLGRYVGGLIYENDKVVGQRELLYYDNGDVLEIIRNEKYKVVSERKLKDCHDNLDKTATNTNSVIIEQHEIITDKNGKTHKIIYDINNNIVSDQEIPQNTKPVAKYITTADKKTHTPEKTIQKSRILGFLLKLLHRER